MIIRPIGRACLDLLYPPACVACGANGDWWCLDCRSFIDRPPQDPCPHCLAIDPDHQHVDNSGLPFTGVVSTGFYHAPALRRLIAALKYEGVTATKPAVEAYLYTALAERPVPTPWQKERSLLIQPMPLAAGRERERGFNQATWFAERLQRAWVIDGERVDLVQRRRGTMAQAELAHETALRSANVRGQFFVAQRLTQPVLLVDDVVTTGSTAAEAARSLLSAGAPRIYLATLAIGK